LDVHYVAVTLLDAGWSVTVSADGALLRLALEVNVSKPSTWY
jgi:hypothetical protein